MVRGLAEVKWMIVSPHPTFIYTGHEALKTLLVGVDNDAHGRIANWQHRLGKCNLLLRHRSHKVYFMGIADSMSRLPTRLQQNHVMEDSIKPDIMVTAASTIRIVPTTADLAWQRRNNTWPVYLAHKGNDSDRQHGRSDGEREHGRSNAGREGECSGGTQTRSEEGQTDERNRSRWSCWLKSRLYGTVVRYLLFGMEGPGYRLKRTERKWVPRLANRFCDGGGLGGQDILAGGRWQAGSLHSGGRGGSDTALST